VVTATVVAVHELELEMAVGKVRVLGFWHTVLLRFWSLGSCIGFWGFKQLTVQAHALYSSSRQQS
jgi:hypothetical protein